MRCLARAALVLAVAAFAPLGVLRTTLAAQPDPPAAGGAQTPAGGCGAPAPNVGAAMDGQPAPQVVQATVGQPFSLTLDSNPTTGYRWGLAQPLDETIVHLVHSAYQRGRPGVIGAGGVETWTFLPICQGTTTIDMEYRRPWERPEQDDRHATYVVVVQ
jgi:inhibitor of cysteine peptidase